MGARSKSGSQVMVERKEAKRRAEMTPAKIELENMKKPRKLEQSKTAPGSLRQPRCARPAWCVRMNVDVINVQSLFCHFQSCKLLCACSSFIFKTRWFMVKVVFLLTITWFVCKRDEATLADDVDAGLTVEMRSAQQTGNRARRSEDPFSLLRQGFSYRRISLK